MKKEEIDVIYKEIVNFAELNDFIDIPVKKYSSGMRARLGFATSINIDPDILILDEVLAVGDELFRRKCYAKMEEIFSKGKIVIYVSHNLKSIIDMCTTAILLRDGKIIEINEPKKVVDYYNQINNNNSKIIKEKNLTPNSIVKTESKDIYLKKAIIENEKNIKTTNVSYNEKVSIKIKLEIAIEIYSPEIALVISDEKGEKITGNILNQKNNKSHKIWNNTIIVENKIKIGLKNGCYFISLLLWGSCEKNGQRKLLYYISDTLAFKVVNQPINNFSIGNFVLENEWSIKNIKEKK